MKRVIKFVRVLVRSILLLPILPLFFRIGVGVLRLFGVLPRVRTVEGAPQRILIVNLTPHVGDVVMMLPLLDRLHAEHPEVKLQVAVGKPMGALLKSLPYLELVHEINPQTKLPFVLHFYARIGRVLRYAKRNLTLTPYDMCLVPRWGTDPFASAYLAYLTDAPVRCGHDPRDEKGVSETFPGTRLLMTKRSRGGRGLLEPVRELRLLAACGLTDPIDETAAKRQTIQSLQTIADTAEDVWTHIGLDPNVPFVVLAPGASMEVKKWPAERFTKAAELIGAEFGFVFVAIGSPAEQELGAELEALSGGKVRSLMGKLSLAESTAVLSRAKLFVGNDSGPAHIAAGLGVRSLIVSMCPESSQIEGISSPLRVLPVGPYVQMLQSKTSVAPCEQTCVSESAHCILQIQPEDLLPYVRLWFQDADRS